MEGTWVCDSGAGGHVTLQLCCTPKGEEDGSGSPVEFIKAQLLKDHPRSDEPQPIMMCGLSVTLISGSPGDPRARP